MEFGKYISQALKITWQQKVLWLFALLPSILYLVFSLVYRPVSPSFYPPQTEQEMARYFAQSAGILGISCLLGITSFLIAPITIGGLIKGIHNALEMKVQGFRKLLQESLQYYGRLLLLLVIMLVVAIIVGVAIAFGFGLLTALMASSTSDQNALAAIPLYFLLICCLATVFLIGAIFIAVILNFAFNGIVVDDLGIGEALSRSWGFIRRQFGNVFAATILYGFMGLVIFGILYAIYFAVYFVALGTSFGSPEAMSRAMYQFSQGWLPFVLSLIVYLASAIIAVYFNALWTQTYIALRDIATPKPITSTPVAPKRAAPKKAARKSTRKS